MSVSFRAFQRRREIQPLADRAPRESATAGMSDHDTSKMNPGSDMVAEPVQPAKPSSTRLKGFVAGWVSGVTKLTVHESFICMSRNPYLKAEYAGWTPSGHCQDPAAGIDSVFLLTRCLRTNSKASRHTRSLCRSHASPCGLVHQ